MQGNGGRKQRMAGDKVDGWLVWPVVDDGVRERKPPPLLFLETPRAATPSVAGKIGAGAPCQTNGYHYHVANKANQIAGSSTSSAV